MDDLGTLTTLVIALAAALVFAMMAWAGQHQS
jgi:hypothetical protein